MGYLHINNLYKDRTILMFRDCYVLEKIHGTSAHISWKMNDDGTGGEVKFFSGGVSHESFVALFNLELLEERFLKIGHKHLTVYGEAYGGKCQQMGRVYGKELRFVVFDVLHHKADGKAKWLNVPDAEEITRILGLEFVYFRLLTDFNIDDINRERDIPSMQAYRNGMGEQFGEGIVIRPLFDMNDHRGNRIIVKHKREEFVEVTHKKHVLTLEEAGVLVKAQEIADQWVTEMRFEHVIDKFKQVFELELKNTGAFIKAMVEDVIREAEDEILDSKEARSAIGKKAGLMYRTHITRIEQGA